MVAQRQPGGGGRAGGALRSLWRSEVHARASIRHPNIAVLLGVCFKHNELAVAIKPYTNGVLSDILSDHTKPLPWSLRLSMLEDAAMGLAHIHNSVVAHGEFMAFNLLVDERYRVHVDECAENS